MDRAYAVLKLAAYAISYDCLWQVASVEDPVYSSISFRAVEEWNLQLFRIP